MDHLDVYEDIHLPLPSPHHRQQENEAVHVWPDWHPGPQHCGLLLLVLRGLPSTRCLVDRGQEWTLSRKLSDDADNHRSRRSVKMS